MSSPNQPKVTGNFMEAPPNAPREVSQPLTAEALQAMQDAAAAHERELPPFNPPAVQRQAADAAALATGQPVPVRPEEAKLHRPNRPAPATTPVETIDRVADAGTVSQRLAAVLTPRPERDPNEPFQPAASNTDSPSRGIPQPILDPGKRITGGFGVPGVGATQYFPLDGYELRQLVERLCDRLKSRVADDLRFMRAMTYPRAFVRLDLTVECWGAALQHHDIPVVEAPHDKTPIEIAREYADEVLFVLREQRREFDDAGTPETPANAIREEISAPIPYKQPIHTSAGTDWVDTLHPAGNIP